MLLAHVTEGRRWSEHLGLSRQKQRRLHWYCGWRPVLQVKSRLDPASVPVLVAGK